jgi:hypothetical protein
MQRTLPLLRWVGATIALVPASFLLWMIGAQASCGEEIYDTPPGSLGDRACNALVEPIVPWALMAAVPLGVGLVAGFAAIGTKHRGLLLFATVTPLSLVVLAIFAALAFF